MEKEDKHSLLQPLITPIFNPSSSSSSSYSHENIDHQNNYEHNIILRILFLLFVALISIWANYEASKTFDINIINDTKDSPAGRRFTLFYISNDKATRILFNTSSFVQNLLYPNNNNKKNIESITLRFASRNLNNSIVVATTFTTTVVEKSFNRYVIEISPMLLEDENFDEIAIVGAIQRAVALIWIWDGGSTAPLGLLNGMAEYVVQLAGFRRERLSGGGGKLPECESCGDGGKWWEDKDSRHVACLLSYCENYKEGFIRRLNEAMKDTWHDRMVDDVLGMKVTKLCGLYNGSWLINSSDVKRAPFN